MTSDKHVAVFNAFCDCLIGKLNEGDTDALKVAENFIHRQQITALPVPGGKLDQVSKELEAPFTPGK
jgi:hypothetical protein